jgi:methyl-accepting chemotaxis protein
MDLRITESATTTQLSKKGLLKRVGRALWMPGVRLMSNLRMPGKLALVVATLAIPLCVLLARDLRDAMTQYQDTHRAAQTLPVIRSAIELRMAVHRLGTLARAISAGDRTLVPAWTAERKNVETSAAQMQASVDRAGHHAGLSHWPGLYRQIQQLASGVSLASAADSLDAHPLVLQGLQELMVHLTDRSGLMDVNGSVSRELAHVLTVATNTLIDATSELNSEAVDVLARQGQTKAGDRSALFGAAWTVEHQVAHMQTLLTGLTRRGIEAPGSWDQAVELTTYLVSNTRQRFSVQQVGGSTAAFLDTTNVVLDQLRTVQHDATSRFDSLIEERKAELVKTHAVLAGLWLFGALLIGYMVTVYILSSWGALRRLVNGMKATADGDLSYRLRVWGKDELAELAQSFDAMNERLSFNASDIRSRATRVDQTGRQVAEENQQLALRTDQQAQSLGDAVRAFSQVSGAVTSNAQATRELDELTHALFGQAEAGNLAMAETMMAVDELESASTKVAEMVAVIDDVAFQTGMLALNAAVEAARAGPAGKGFAVVAGEVRQLSQRCAEAAEVIRNLTQSSTEKVHTSSQKLQQVSVSIDRIVNGVREVSERLRSIAEAGTQQTASLTEVEANMESLQAITNDNAALVEQSNTAANTLVNLGSALTSTVGHLRLRHGSADEARALVERAVALAQERGRDKALEDFNLNHETWTDRDLFIFCLDRSGIILANAMTPARVGRSVDMLDGLRGTRHSDKLWDCIDSHGSGWVRYQIVHPLTGQLRDKETYVFPIDESTLVGCGCYSGSGTDGTREPPRPVAWSRKSEVTAASH